MADRSQTSTGLSVYVYGGLHKMLTLPATVLLAKKQLYNVPLKALYTFCNNVKDQCSHLVYPIISIK